MPSLTTKPKVHRIPIHAAVTPPRGQERGSYCKLSADIAHQLGLGSGSATRVRIGVTREDINTLYNPAYLDFLGCESVFSVTEILDGFERVEIFPNSGPGEKDGGVFRLYATAGNPFSGARIPENARVTVSTVC